MAVTVDKLRTRLGYSTSQWKYFTKLVRTLLEEVFEQPHHKTSMPDDDAFRVECQSIAASINNERSQPPSRWADFKPLHIQEILQILNEEMGKQKMTLLAEEDLKDRVDQLISYRRSKTPTLPSIANLLVMPEEAERDDQQETLEAS